LGEIGGKFQGGFLGDIVNACGEDLNQVIAVHYSFLAVRIRESG
jgi:hypothetical protein